MKSLLSKLGVILGIIGLALFGYAEVWGGWIGSIMAQMRMGRISMIQKVRPGYPKTLSRSGYNPLIQRKVYLIG